MNKLNTKTSAILMLVSFIVWQVLTRFFPLGSKLIEYSLTSIFALSAILFVAAVLKARKWLSIVAHYWSAVILPIVAAQLLAIDYLAQYVSPEDLLGVLIAYWLMTPFIVSGLAIYQSLVCIKCET